MRLSSQSMCAKEHISNKRRFEMSDALTHDDLEEFAGQFYDLNINPLADVVVRILSLLRERNVLTHDESIWCVAESVKVISPLSYSTEVKEQSAATLMRMISALQS